MTALFLLNAGIYLVVGIGLLLVWQRHRTQAFARDMGCSTLFAALLPLGYLLRTGAAAGMRWACRWWCWAPCPTCCSSPPAPCSCRAAAARRSRADHRAGAVGAAAAADRGALLLGAVQYGACC
jgi:hypothetical protein